MTLNFVRVDRGTPSKYPKPPLERMEMNKQAKPAVISTNVQVATKNAGVLMFAQTAPNYINQSGTRGSEEVRAADIVLPRLEIVQSQSPIKEVNEEAKEGHMFNSVTGEVIGDTAYFVPVYYRMEYLVWKDQEQGGGFFGAFNSQEEAEARVRRAVADGEDPQYMEVMDTPVQYGLLVRPDGSTEQIVISMAKSKAKVSRKWNAMIQIVGGDRFARVYKITTFRDKNKKDQKFFNYVVQPAGYTPESIYRAAEKVYEMFKTQTVSVAHDTAHEMSESDMSPAERGDI